MAWRMLILATIYGVNICLSEAKTNLPDGIDEEANCVACETMASQIFQRLSAPDLKQRKDRVDEVLKNICGTGYFKNVIKYQPRDMAKACKSILDGHKKQIKATIESVLSSTGTLAELTQGMCHISSSACRNVRKPSKINTKINTIEDEDVLDGIEAYIKAHPDADIKIAGRPRKEEL